MIDYILCSSKRGAHDVANVLQSSSRSADIIDYSVRDLANALQSSSVVILDCSGTDLGSQNGCLRLIGIRVVEPQPSDTYLIDTLQLREPNLRPLFDLIQSSAISKIVFDGRRSFSELYHSYSVEIEGTLDLQIADVTSRIQRGETERDQRRRVSTYLAVDNQPDQCGKICHLLPFEECLSEHGIRSDGLTGNHPDYRHLSAECLRYASRRVNLVGQLYSCFKEKGYLTNDILAQSARHVSIWRDTRLSDANPYRNHSLLAHHILNYPGNSSTEQCAYCRLHLPKTAYAKKEGKNLPCLLCRAINAKNWLPSGQPMNNQGSQKSHKTKAKAANRAGSSRYCRFRFDSDSDFDGWPDWPEN